MRYVINAYNKKSKINKEIYGHFSEHLGRCIYEGIYVGEDSKIPNTKGMRNDVVAALKEAKIPVLRWPGGCFADEYHWKDGIGEKETRKKMINTHWGGVVEDNSFGTHEFFDLCELIGCEPYVNGNVGSGTVAEMQEWVEYMTFDGLSPMSELRKKNGKEQPWKLKYFCIGNENWGCGGNMRPEYYADEYRRYATYVRNFGGNNIYKMACGPNGDNYEWTEVLMERIPQNLVNAITLHYYTIPGNWQKKGSALDFNDEEWYKTLSESYRMEELITKHSGIMDKYDPEKKVDLIVDEWGTWFDVEPGTNPGFLYQQNTVRDALIAGLNLNIFNKHSDRVKMANIAQIVNVLQSLILTEGEKMILTPTYHVFNMYKLHMEGQLLDSYIENETIGTDSNKLPFISESASIDENGNICVSLCNMSLDKEAVINAETVGKAVAEIKGSIVTGEKNAHNTFDAPDTVVAKEFADFKITEKGFEAKVPAKSVVVLTLK